MEKFDMSAALTSLVGEATSQMTSAAPILLGAIGVFAGVNIGIKIFKRVVNKIG